MEGGSWEEGETCARERGGGRGGGKDRKALVLEKEGEREKRNSPKVKFHTGKNRLWHFLLLLLLLFLLFSFLMPIYYHIFLKTRTHTHTHTSYSLTWRMQLKPIPTCGLQTYETAERSLHILQEIIFFFPSVFLLHLSLIN